VLAQLLDVDSKRRRLTVLSCELLQCAHQRRSRHVSLLEIE
jgi:hypothetical protein